MKSLIPVISLAFIIFSSALASIFGIGIMVMDLYTGGDDFMQGFTTFCLGTILFFVCVIAYICTKINDKLSVVADSMINFFDFEISKGASPAVLSNLFSGFTGQPAEIKIMGSEQNEEADKLIKLLFGQNVKTKKTLEQMNATELEAEKAKAVDVQDFETAAKIQVLIDALKK